MPALDGAVELEIIARGTPGFSGADLANLVVPRRPSGISYETGEDYDAQALLTANGYTTETQQLIDLLDSNLSVFQAAAARTLGAKGVQTAIHALEHLADDNAADETSRTQAAFALARMQIAKGKDVLSQMLELSPEASPAPLQAAGALAQLGDPRGYALVRAALSSSNPLTAMIACKQLFTFVALDGQPLSDGEHVDVYGLYKLALERSEANISGEAHAQLEALNTEQARATLAAHAVRKH